MQNSVTMGLCAVVLLICLVGVPLFAVFGKNVPEVVKALLRNYAIGPAENNSSDAAAGNDTSFRPGLVATQGQPPRNLPSEAADDTTHVPRPLVPVAEGPSPNHATQTGEAISQPFSQLSKNGAAACQWARCTPSRGRHHPGANRPLPRHYSSTRAAPSRRCLPSKN